jgi:hypothetical protein
VLTAKVYQGSGYAEGLIDALQAEFPDFVIADGG